MRIRYDQDEDILLIEASAKGKIGHAEHAGSMIAHLSREGRLILLEILDASEFLSAALKAALRRGKPEPSAAGTKGGS